MEKKKERKWKNKKFNIFGDKWTIMFGDKVMESTASNPEEHWVWGLTVPTERKLLISTISENDRHLADDDIMCTIAHECVHAILDSGQYCNASNDEPMVEFLAKGILSLIKSKVFEYEKV